MEGKVIVPPGQVASCWYWSFALFVACVKWEASSEANESPVDELSRSRVCAAVSTGINCSEVAL